MKFPRLGAAALLLSVSTPALAVGQLPGNVAPIAYDITVKPDARAMTFSGTETVAIAIKEATRTIVLNAADMKLGLVSFDGKAVPFTLDPALQQMTVTLPAPAMVGTHEMRFAWDGKINTSAAGFFAIDYTNTDGSASRMLVTQFEAPDARRFAPMWDEPSFKAKFTLRAVAPGGQTAFSNMPAATVTRQGDGSKLYRFAQSPIMSSYLLFLGMGDVQRKTVMAGKTEIGIITRRGVVDQGDYALAQAKRLLTYYNNYFGQPYPLPKLAMIAGPGSSQFFGAMENWGAIFYFEPEVLFDPKRATESGRQRIYTVVAHEMAHQWFGDLVTMKWWDDLWLNEGFASWMENKSSGDLNPGWAAPESAVAEDREGALALDATAATHPVIRHVQTVDDLNEAFDTITYNKGQAVIGMIEATVGPDVFRDGIRRYMAKYKYHNTETDQLWAELAAAAGKPIADVAHDFTLQGGVPIVSVSDVTCVAGKTRALLSQGRFGLDAASKAPQDWRVPLTLGLATGTATRVIVRGATPQPAEVAGCGPLVVNRDKQSYVRIRYDAAAHADLIGAFGTLAVTDQLGTLGDDYALAMSGDQGLAPYLADQAKVSIDASPLVWQMVSTKLGNLTGLFGDGALHDALRARSNAILSPALARVGYAAKQGESPLVTNLREKLIERLGADGDVDTAVRARAYFAAMTGSGTPIPPAIRTPILATYATNATPAEWDALLALTKAETNPVAKNAYVRLLGNTRDDATAARALDLLAGDTFTTPQKASLLKSIAAVHPDLAFDFAVANREMVDGFVEQSASAGYIVGLGQQSNDPAMPAKIAAFTDKYLPEGSQKGARKTLALIASREETAVRVRADVAAWLGVAG